MTFSSKLDELRPVYEIPDDDLIGEVLVPAMQLCDRLRIGAGFFSSRCLAQIAPGLAAFINETDATLELMVSPEIALEDREAIRNGSKEPQVVLAQAMELLFESAQISASAIERHAAQTLAYLIASNRLEMRVVLMERGMYHKKLWLMGAEEQWLAVHGSGNATERGLLVNGEQMSVDRGWLDGPQAQTRIRILLDRWDSQWANRHPRSMTVSVGEALHVLRKDASAAPPTIDDFWEAWHRDHEAGLEPPLPSGYDFAPIHHRLRIPPHLIWREGRFAHQGPAVDALMANDGGIVSVATGGGKTRIALIAGVQLQDNAARHLCVVILSPTRPLVRQWTDDIRGFGIEPIVLTGMNKAQRDHELARAEVAFQTSQPRTEVLIMSNALFAQRNSDARAWIDGLPDSVSVMLIADEVHHLGTPSFVENLPTFFRYRIGLSATPIRQFDPDGTDQLFAFFGGPPVFEFSLKEAIRSGCLVPYNYHLHVVTFEDAEIDEYEALTERLARAGFRVDDDGRSVGLSDTVARLLRERRALVEQARAKLPALEAELRRIGVSLVHRTLIYASAKPVPPGRPRQIIEVNRLLQSLGIISHQFTAEETGSVRSRALLDRFGAGDYQVLTSMRVLDEGVDIPQTDTAFLIASSTVEREWIQRRGRILRHAPGKSSAELHDFLVVPPDLTSNAATSLLRSELRRVRAFADVSENEYDVGGPDDIIRRLEAELYPRQY